MALGADRLWVVVCTMSSFFPCGVPFVVTLGAQWNWIIQSVGLTVYKLKPILVNIPMATEACSCFFTKDIMFIQRPVMAARTVKFLIHWIEAMTRLCFYSLEEICIFNNHVAVHAFYIIVSVSRVLDLLNV